MKKETHPRQQARKYIPAAGKDWLLPLYDPMTKLLGVHTYLRKLVAQAALQSNQQVLDIGCGTGTLMLMIKQLFPAMSIIGIDPDPKALAKAQQKAEKAHLMVQLDQGFSEDLPYPAASFDRVFSSFMLHHLQPTVKEAMLRESRRVLKSGGSLHLVDFVDWRQSDAEKKDPSSHILSMMYKAGFSKAGRLLYEQTFFGPVVYFKAS